MAKDRARSEKALEQPRDRKGRFISSSTKLGKASSSESHADGSGSRFSLGGNTKIRRASPTSSGTTSTSASPSREGAVDRKEVHGGSTSTHLIRARQGGPSKVRRNAATDIARGKSVQIKKYTIVLTSSSSDYSSSDDSSSKKTMAKPGKEKGKEVVSKIVKQHRRNGNDGNKIACLGSEIKKEKAGPSNVQSNKTTIVLSSSSSDDYSWEEQMDKEKCKEEVSQTVNEDRKKGKDHNKEIKLNVLELHNKISASKKKIACLSSEIKKEKQNKRKLEQELGRATKTIVLGYGTLKK